MESVLITGASGKVGSLIARRLADRGYFIWLHFRSREEKALDVCSEIRKNGGMAECIRADLTQDESIESMLRYISKTEEGGNLTTLINNASVMVKGSLSETTGGEWDTIMNTNLKSVWYLSKEFVRNFPGAKRIITLGDASVSRGYAQHAVYGLSKYALRYLTEQMAAAYAPQVRVNLLSPGFVLKGEKESEACWNARTSRTLNDNGNIVEELLTSVQFLMEDPGITGSEIFIDNGLHLCRSSGL